MPMFFWGTLILSKREGKRTKRKRTFLVNLVSSNPVLKMVLDQGKMPLVSSTPSNWMISEKAFGELTRLFLSQSGKRFAPTCKGACGSSIIFISTMRLSS